MKKVSVTEEFFIYFLMLFKHHCCVVVPHLNEAILSYVPD